MRKKLLIITYYWPPAGGGGVQRWMKFTKYLREFGWEPVIYTVSNGEYPVMDESLLKEIPADVETIKTPIWEPYSFYKRFTGRKKGERVYSGFINENKKESFTQKVSVFIRGNFFIPDARKFWISPSIKYLRKYLKNNPVDAMVSTGPPHTTHLIAMGVKEKINVPWVADFRDPWTNIDFYDQLRLSDWADKKHRRLEKEVLKKADKVVTVSWSWADDFRRIGNRQDIEIITNGYDEADFADESPALTEKFTICHIGSMNKDRNPLAFWTSLKELLTKHPTFKEKLEIVLVGQVDFSILQTIEKNDLSPFLTKIDFMPHSEVVKEIRKMQLLLLPINDTPNVAGVLPGKLYEYLGAKRPVICLGPQSSDSAKIIEETKAGIRVGYDESDRLTAYLENSFQTFLQTGAVSVKNEGILRFSRKNLAKAYSELLNKLTAKTTA